MFKITTLIENNSFDSNLHHEKGLSLLIENSVDKIVFDYGLTDKFWENATTLGFNPSIFNYGIISHGHSDHVGGAPKMLQRNMFHTIYANELIFNPKFKNVNNEKTENGITTDLLSARGRFVFFEGVIEVSKDVFALTNITDGRLEERYVDENGNMDTFSDETIVVLKGEKGLHVVLGCCHKGLKASLETVKLTFPNDDIISVVGGLHIHDADYDFLQETITAIKDHNVKSLIVGHCTGANGISYLTEQTNCSVTLLYTGSTYTLP